MTNQPFGLKKSKPPGGPVKPWLKKQCGPAFWCIGQLGGEYLAKIENVLAVYNQEPPLGRARLCFDKRPLRWPGCQLLDDVVAPLLIKPGKATKEDNVFWESAAVVSSASIAG